MNLVTAGSKAKKELRLRDDRMNVFGDQKTHQLGIMHRCVGNMDAT